MKTTLRDFIFALLSVVGGMAVLAGNAQSAEEPLPPKTTSVSAVTVRDASAANAQCGDDSLPPKVKALIGKKLPPKVVGMEPAKIPGLIQVNGALIVDSGEAVTKVLAYSEGGLEGKLAVFFMERIDRPSQEIEILDARMLPANLLDWRLKNGIPEGNSGQYKLSGRCRANDKDERIILGLVRPERGKSDCTHFSKRIKQAWQMDMKLGCLIPIATKGLQCEYITMNDCYE